MPKVHTLKSVAGVGIILKEFAQKVVTEAPGAFNEDETKPSIEKRGYSVERHR